MNDKPANQGPEAAEVIFIAALALKASERAAYLETACGGGDAGLRARVEALLAAHEGAGTGFLPEEASAKATIKLEFPSDGLPSEKPGDCIGRYKLLEKIGEGGFGAVYVAEQREPVKRRVALKIIKLGMDTREVVGRFEAERQALAMMDHPNIAKVFDAGALENGRPYFVMELVRGIKITEYCDQNKLPNDQRLDLFVKICHAVQHAHQKGIIHRDIKPSNILVTLHDGVPVPKVIDFGIAKATQGELTDKTVYTQFRQFIGTPAYMSPEQAEMSGLDIDTRSDIYSLGVLLYELLTGKTPFEQKELMAAGIDGMRRMIRDKEPPRPSTRLSTMVRGELTDTAQRRQADVSRFVHSVRGDLDWIVMKCLEKDRTHRYETANGLAMDVKRHLENEPVTARPPSTGYRMQKAWRRHKTAFAVGSLIAFVLVAATVISVWQAVMAKRAKAEAVQRAAEAQAIANFMTGVFENSDPEHDGRTVTVVESLERGARKLETEMAGQPEIQALLEDLIGNTYCKLSLPQGAVPLLEKCHEYCLMTRGPEYPNTLKSSQHLAAAYLQAGRPSDARKLMEASIPFYVKVFGPDDTNTLFSKRILAKALGGEGRIEEGIRVYEELLPLFTKVEGPEGEDTVGVMASIVDGYRTQGRFDQAIELGKQELAVCRKTYGAEHFNTLNAMQVLAFVYKDAGQRKKAIELLEELLPLDRKVLGPEHPMTLEVMEILSDSYAHGDRVEDGVKLGQESVDLCRKALGPDHFETLDAMFGLANVYDAAKRNDDALKLREQILPLCQKQQGLRLDSPFGAALMNNLALNYSLAGRLDEAIKLERTAVETEQKVWPENYNTINCMNNLAGFCRDAGRVDEAIQVIEELVSLRIKVRGATNQDTLDTIGDLANCYNQVGRHQEALKLLTKASESDPKSTTVLLDAAAWQAWYRQDADYETSRHQGLDTASGTDVYRNADAAAKAYCFRPSTNNSDLIRALALAHHAAVLQTNFWITFDLGLAEFRNGQFAEAERTIVAAKDAARQTTGDGLQEVPGMSDLIRAMILFREGHGDDAKKVFDQAKAEMPPLPADETKPAVKGLMLSHDLLLWWLLYKEADAALLKDVQKEAATNK